MNFHNWFLQPRARIAMTSGVAAILFAVFGTTANAQTWTNSSGTGVWLDGANWVGGTAPTGIAADAIVGAPSPVQLNGSVNINSLTVNADGVVTVGTGQNLDFGGTATTTLNNAGTINTENNTDLQFQNNVINSGAINVNATTANTDLEIDAAGASLDGGGTVTLSGTGAGINGLGGATLTIVDQTIQGQGNIGENSIGIVNQADGLIDANTMGQTLTIDASTAAGASNAGTLQASSGGVLQISGTVLNNTGGEVIAQNDSEVRLATSSVTGGTLSTTGTGQLTVAAGTNVGLTNTTITSDSTLVSEDNSDTEVSGTITNQGAIQITATGSNTDIEVQTGGATLTGGGTVQLVGGSAGINGVSGAGTLTIGDQTIEGQGSIGENSIGIVNSSTGLIDANVADAILQIDGSTAGGVDNEGVIQASDEGILRIFGTSVNNDDGLIVAQDLSEVRLNSSTITGGRIDTELGGQFVVEGGANVRFEDVNNTGNVISLNNSDTELLGTFENSGQLEIQAGGANTDIEVQAGDATLTGGGTIRLTGSNAGINGVGGGVLDIQSQLVIGEGNIGENSLGLLLGPGGTIEADVASSSLNIDIAGSVLTEVLTNNGTLRASNLSTLNSVHSVENNGTIEVRDDSLVFARSLSSTAGSLLTGEGRIDVDTGPINVAGTVAPGDGVGTLNLLDNTIFASTATLATQLQSDSLFDLLQVDGDLNLDGLLSVDLLGGFDPLSTDTFLIADATNVFGEFSNVANGGLLVTEGGEGTFTVNYLSDGVQLSNFTLTAVPEPSAVVLLAGMGLGFVLRRRRQA